MKLRKNEQGYALVLVLLLIVFIAIVSAAFMKISISNAKQEQIVDKNNLSVVLAEMGVELYSNTYLNAYYVKKDSLLSKFKSDFESAKNKIANDKNISDKSAAIKKEHNILRQKTSDQLSAYLEGVSLPNASVPNNSSIKGQFEFDSENYIVLIHGTVFGDYNKGKLAKLTMNLSFEVPSLLNNKTDGEFSSGDLSWYTKREIPFINKPKEKCFDKPNTEPCLANEFKDIISGKNSILYFDKNVNKEDNGKEGKDFKGLKVYLEGNLILPNMQGTRNLEIFSKNGVEIKNGNGGGISNSTIMTENNIKGVNIDFFSSKIYAEKNIEVNQFSMQNGSKMFAGNKLIINNHATINSSTIVIGEPISTNSNNGNLISKKKFEIFNSTIFVRDNFINGQSVKIADGSKMCVGSNIDAKTIIITPSSKLYILKHNNELEKKANVIKVESLEALQEACKIGESSTVPDNTSWKKPIIEVTY